MSIAKIFHLILLIIFGSLSLVSFNYEYDKASKLADEALQQYLNSPIWKTTLPVDGKSLFTTLNSQYPFYFFQYIHGQDGTLNYTEGQLLSGNDDVIAALFAQGLGDTRNLAEGRLQVKIDDSKITSKAKQAFVSNITIIWLLYLVIATIFSLLMMRLKRSIVYASGYIDALSELKFEALAHSRFRGELKPIGVALDKARSILHDKFDEMRNHNLQLNKEVYQDPITLFNTRPKFTQKLDSLAKAGKDNYGIMAMIKATELANINQSQGREAGDNYLAGIASCIRKSIANQQQAECFRISASDFAVFIPNLLINDVHGLLNNLKSNFDAFQQTIDIESVAYTGLVPYKQGNDALSLVYLGDAAVSIAQTMGPNSCHIQEKLNGDELIGDSHWKTAIEDIIQRQALKFHAQDIQPCRGADKVYRELFSRFYSREGKFLPTATVIAMAERHGLNVELDKIIIQSTIKLLINNPRLTGTFGINVSTASMHQAHFSAWIKDLLTRYRHIAARLVIEVNESGMQSNIGVAHQFVRDMHGVGARVSVEHFGLGFTSFKFFKEIRPDFVKLDGSYTEGIDINDNNRFFVKMIVNVAQKQSIKVIATSVERQEEKFTLEHLLVDGLQGYYIAKPKPIAVTDEHSATS